MPGKRTPPETGGSGKRNVRTAGAGDQVARFFAGPLGDAFVSRVVAAIEPMVGAGPAARNPGVEPAAPITLDLLGARLQAVDGPALDTLAPLPIQVDTAMDPRLQLVVANLQSGKQGPALASVGGDEVAVVARVTSAAAWAGVPDVLPGGAFGKAEDGSAIVTGRLPIGRIEAVRADPCVLSLKASQPVRPALAATIEAMEVGAAALPAGVDPDGGAGVVVGIVDFGGDFAHANFRRADGGTRLLALWNQAGVARPDSPFGYGRLHRAADIDAALASRDPYAALGYGPAPDTPFQMGAHGTHVMDIAAGNGGRTGQPGVAPKADLVFVEASISDIALQGPDSVNQSFGDSVQLLEAVRFVFDLAGDRPCVVNLSLGTNGGPHDGSSLVEQGLDALVNERANRAVVIAASNSQEQGAHASGAVPGDAAHDIVWRQRDGGEFELWYPGARRLAVTLVAPDGTAFGPVAPGENLPIGTPGRIAVFISNRLDDPNNHDNVIGVWLAAGLSSADFTVRLRSLDGEAVEYHAWIERDDRAQGSFAAPTPTHTLGSISTGRATIVVGSFDGHKPERPLSSFSSAGPTRDGREKPELSAPGQNVVAARSRTGDGVTRKSGTSMAAPAVTGLVALVLAEARRGGRDLASEEIRRRLLAGVLRDPPALAGDAWDPRYGRGRASGRAIGEAVA